MDYKVCVTDDAYDDLDRYIFYLLFAKKSEQAAEKCFNINTRWHLM